MTRRGGSGQPAVRGGGPDWSAPSARRRKPARKSAPGLRRWILLSIAALALVGGAAVLLRSGEESAAATAASGTLAPERTSHDFGQVPMGGGLVQARFPLAVESEALVTSIITS